MKRTFTILTAALALLAFLAIPMGMMGQTSVTWPGTSALPGTATAVANDQNVTIMVSSTNTYTNPIRVYANTTITISALNDAKILSVAYEASSTGNYVTNAQEATVTPNVTPTVSGKIVTWAYAESDNVTEFTFKPSSQTRSNGITITYIIPGATPTCATPTFSPAAGTYTEPQSVSISCTTEDATIYYTTDGNDPTTNSTVYSEAISVSSNMTIKAMATAEGYDNSAVATAEYAIITLDHAGTLADPYTVADARAAIDAGTGVTNVYATGIVSAIPTAYNSTYGNITFNMIDEEGDEVFLQAYRCGGDEAANVAVGDVAVVYGSLIKYGSTYEFGQGCQLVSLTHPVITTPTVTVTPNTIDAPAEETEGTLAITFENIPDLISFDYYFCDASGVELDDTDPDYPDWIVAEIQGDTAVYYFIVANDGAARTAYIKVYTLDDDLEEIYAIVTVNQEEYVAPTYAALPFSFNGGKEIIEGIDGFYQDGLGNDYNANTNPTTKLKFDSTGDWLLLQFNERPGTLTFDIKGNTFSEGTFKVQTSEDGTTFTDLKTYTDSNFGNTLYEEEFTDLGENVRYIKWIYTNKSSGNVGLGNIALAEYVEPVIVPSITIDPDHFDLDANSHMAETLTQIIYQNIEIVSGSGVETFDVQYYDAEGNETEQSWCVIGPTAITGTDDSFELDVFVMANEGDEARTIYFKVVGHDAENNPVYSNLVIVTQAAPVIDYAVLPFVWEGGSSADFAALNGTTLSGNGSDYNANNHAPYLIKLDNDDDYIQVKTDSQPGKVTIGVKMIGGGNTSTITVQGSSDGETFTDIEELAISGTQGDELTLETTNAFDGNDRYVRLLFTKGSNVGVGPITIEKGSASSITVTPATLDLEAVGQAGGTGYQIPSLTVTYHNLDITGYGDFAVQFYDSEGVEQTQPDWITNTVGVVGSNEVGYTVNLMIPANEGDARSAYFKVYAMDDEDNLVYSNLVTINQAAGVAQQYTLTVEPFENLELITFVNGEMVMEAEGEIQVNDGDHIMLSIVAEEGYVMETLMVNGVDHVNDIAEDFTYEFDMPAEAVTINATAVEYVAPVGSDYVRINSLDQLTDGSIVVIAARYDEEHTNGYYAMSNASSGKPTGVLFTSTTSGNNETLPISITDNEDDYYWTVNVTENGYTFTNAEGFMIGYSSSTNFATGGSNTEWSIELSTSEGTAMVANYTGFVITNVNNQVRHFALNSSHNFGPYHDNNINNSGYNFILDFFLQSEAPVTETYTLDIEGYTDVTEGTNNKGYYLIASPVTVDPATVEGMTEDDFDLYYFDQSEENEWRNYEENTFSLVPGKGYLYAKKGNETYNFTLTGTPYDGDGEIGLDYDVNAEFPGFNLIGNPFATDATLDLPYYRLNEDGSALNTYTEISAVNVMEGVFVQATAATRTATFSTDAKRISQLNLKVTHDRSVVLDNAIIRFDGGSMLGKFQLNPDDTKIYITDGNEDFAVVCSAAEGEMPVSFRASENGTYTISVNAENVEATYLHLIDNMTGADVDLLATPSYSFEASTTDYTSRFKLSYKANTSVDENNASTSSTFAYYNGNAWVISNMGEATLQVVDMMGRVLSSESINGNVNVNLNQPAGIYMIRLVNGDNVKVQKVVVR